MLETRGPDDRETITRCYVGQVHSLESKIASVTLSSLAQSTAIATKTQNGIIYQNVQKIAYIPNMSLSCMLATFKIGRLTKTRLSVLL